MSFYPYIPFIVEYLIGKGADNKEISTKSGYIVSAYFITKTIMAYPWARLSDLPKFGRRGIIIFGNFGSALTFILIGLASPFNGINYFVILLFRFLAGALSGSVGVNKTMITEICSPKLLPRGLAYVSGAFYIGSIAGSIIGGFLPQYPKPFVSTNSIFHPKEGFPFLLVNIVVSSSALIGAIYALFYLKESLPPKEEELDSDKFSISSTLSELDSNSEESFWNYLYKNKYIYLVISLYSGSALIFMFFELATIVLLSRDLKDGGVKFTSVDIGTGNMFGGFFAVIYQFILVPWISKKITALSMFQLSTSVLVFSFFLIPLIRFTYPWGHWPLWIFSHFVNKFGTALGMTSSIILTNKCGPPKYLSLINGIAQVSTGIARSIGPSLSGFALTLAFSIDSKFSSFLPFIIVSLLMIFFLFISTKLPKFMNGIERHEDWNEGFLLSKIDINSESE